MAFLSDNCTFHELTDDVLAVSEPFTCGNDDLDDFFAHDATRYAHFLMGKTTGCRFVIVDAVNEPQVIAFYEKNDFHCLFSSEEQEFLYTGGKKGQPVVLTTRLMYYDLLEMRK